MDEKKVNLRSNNDRELFVLSPSIVQNLCLKLKDASCTSEMAVANSEKKVISEVNNPKINNSSDLTTGNVDTAGMSIVETANLMKKSVFISPTFVQTDKYIEEFMEEIHYNNRAQDSHKNNEVEFQTQIAPGTSNSTDLYTNDYESNSVVMESLELPIDVISGHNGLHENISNKHLNANCDEKAEVQTHQIINDDIYSQNISTLPESGKIGHKYKDMVSLNEGIVAYNRINNITNNVDYEEYSRIPTLDVKSEEFEVIGLSNSTDHSQQLEIGYDVKMMKSNSILTDEEQKSNSTYKKQDCHKNHETNGDLHSHLENLSYDDEKRKGCNSTPSNNVENQDEKLNDRQCNGSSLNIVLNLPVKPSIPSNSSNDMDLNINNVNVGNMDLRSCTVFSATKALEFERSDVDDVKQNGRQEFDISTNEGNYRCVENKHVEQKLIKTNSENNPDSNSTFESTVFGAQASNLELTIDNEKKTIVSEKKNYKAEEQSRTNKKVLCGKLKDFTITKRCIKNKCDQNAQENKSELGKEINTDPGANIDLIASYLKQITELSLKSKKTTVYKNNKKIISKLSIQEVEKSGGIKQHFEEQTVDFLRPKRFGERNVYKKTNISNKQNFISSNTVHEGSSHPRIENTELNYTEKVVPVNIHLGFCICADYGQISYEKMYENLDHLHYQRKVSSEFHITDFFTKPNFSCYSDLKNSLSEEISNSIVSVNETPNMKFVNICWKGIEDLTEHTCVEENIEVDVFWPENKVDIKDINDSQNSISHIRGLESHVYIKNSQRDSTKEIDAANLGKDNVNNRQGIENNREMVNIQQLNTSESCLPQTYDVDVGIITNANGITQIAENNTISTGFQSPCIIQSSEINKEYEKPLTSPSRLVIGMDNSVITGRERNNEVPKAPTNIISSKRSASPMGIDGGIPNKKPRITTTSEDCEQVFETTVDHEQVVHNVPECSPRDVSRLNNKKEKCMKNKFLKDLKDEEEVSEALVQDKEGYIDFKNIVESNINDLYKHVDSVKKEDDHPLQNVCGVCNKVIKKANWITHIQKKHNYLAWQLGENPLDCNDIHMIKEHLINICKDIGLLICKHCGRKQKRCKRTFDKYVDLYIEHVQKCGSQTLISPGVSQDSVISEEADSSLPVPHSMVFSDADENMDVTQMIVCGVCEESVDRVDWGTHIQRQHNYIAWKKGDTKLDYNDSHMIKEHLINICKEFGLLICKHCGRKQKRYRRTFDKYIDLYIEHVLQCGSQAEISTDVTQDSVMSKVVDNSMLVPDSLVPGDANENMEVKQIIVCGVCEESVNSIYWTTHIQNQHNYIAWKKGDAKLDSSDSHMIKEHLINICKDIGLLICKHCGKKKKRHRSFDEYVDHYIEHVQQCGSQTLISPDVTHDSVISEEADSSLPVPQSMASSGADENLDVTQIIVCGVCEESVDRVDWCTHIQNKHNYIAWKKGDTELDSNDNHRIKEHLINICKEFGLLICKHCGRKLKRSRRTFDKYIDLYWKHVQECGSQLLISPNAAQNSLISEDADADNSQPIPDSMVSGDADENIDIKQIIVCGVCEESVIPIDWGTHIQTQHNYIAWRKGDTELDSSDSHMIKEHLISICKEFGLLICKHCRMKQKRYRRTFDKYVDLYIEHVQQCGSRALISPNVTQDSVISEEADSSLPVPHSMVSSDADENLDVTQIIVCGVCEESVDRVDWGTHIQNKHNYIAWKKGDTELDFNDSHMIKMHLINTCKEFGPLICNHCGIKQKRSRRPFEKYIDMYLDHLEQCRSQVSEPAHFDETNQELACDQSSVSNVVDNNSLLAVDSTPHIEVDETNAIKYETFVCGVCQQSVKNIEWTKHIQTQHNYIAWKEGETALDFNNTFELQTYLINLCKDIRYLFCNKCGKRLNRYMRTDERYVHCFIDHIENCKSLNTDERNSYVAGSNVMLSREQMTVGSTRNDKTCVTCGVCRETVEATSWIEHTQKTHNYIAWQEGADPIDLNNSQEVEVFLMELYKKIGPLSCSNCGKILKKLKNTQTYIKKFLDHVKHCRDDVISNQKCTEDTADIPEDQVTCAVCSDKMSNSKWKRHLLRKHYNLAWRVDVDEPLDLHDNKVIERILNSYREQKKMTCNNCGISRASIFGFFAHIITCQKTEKEMMPYKFRCDVCGSWPLRVYYQQHMAGHKLQESNKEWKKLMLEPEVNSIVLKEEEVDVAVSSGKRKAAHKAMAIMEKYRHAVNESKHKCKRCGFATDYEPEFEDHKCAVDGITYEDSSDSAEFSTRSSSESSDDIDDSLSDEENNTVRKKKGYRDYSTSHKFFKMPFSVKDVDTYLIEGGKRFKEVHYTDGTLFPEWLCSPCTEVIPDEVQKYLPPLEESSKIKLQKDWVTFKRFEVTQQKACAACTMFVGGCVSCVAWAPGPARPPLALVAHSSADAPRLLYDALYEHPALIQIWDCDTLGNTGPTLSLGIVHEFGTVWSMEWCPSGAHEPPAGARTRLGLLAVACSNGYAYVFSVPHPSSMPNKFYKLQPVAELRLWTNSDRVKYQATAISWSKEKGHSVVAVGYSDGTIAMFDLNTDSPLLRHEQNNTTVFYPYSDDRSVCSTITGIDMYPCVQGAGRASGTEAVGCASTTGASLRVSTAAGPTHIVRSKVAANGALFSPQWPALLLSTDDNTSTRLVCEVEVWGAGWRPGSVRSAAACATPCRAFMWTQPYVWVVRAHPLYNEIKKYPIVKLEMLPLKDTHTSKRKRADDDLSLKVEPTVYEDAVAEYGIRVEFLSAKDRRGEDSSGRPERAGGPAARVGRPERYPLAEPRALAVCPASERRDWLAIGSHAGFVFIVRT